MVKQGGEETSPAGRLIASGCAYPSEVMVARMGALTGVRPNGVSYRH